MAHHAQCCLQIATHHKKWFCACLFIPLSLVEASSNFDQCKECKDSAANWPTLFLVHRNRVGPSDRAEVSPCLFFHTREAAGPTHMEHVVETGVFVGRTQRGELVQDRSCEPPDNIVIVRLSGLLQPSVRADC